MIKNRRLRQGYFDLVIWEHKLADLSYSFTTPGFPTVNEQAKDINVLFSKIRKEEPKDKITPKAIKNRLHQLYLDSSTAYLEICLPDFDYPVIFDESCYNSIQRDYLFPDYTLEAYQNAYLGAEPKYEMKEEQKVSKEADKISLKNAGLIKFHD